MLSGLETAGTNACIMEMGGIPGIGIPGIGGMPGIIGIGGMPGLGIFAGGGVDESPGPSLNGNKI